VSRADEAAELLTEIVERGKTSGRPGGDDELARVLAGSLDAYALACLCAVARSRLGAVNGARTRQAAIDSGNLRPNGGQK